MSVNIANPDLSDEVHQDDLENQIRKTNDLLVMILNELRIANLHNAHASDNIFSVEEL